MENKSYGHLMIDLETMGNVKNSAIVSIGAVEFNIENGDIGEEFYAVVNLQSCLDKGMVVNGDTIYWWLNQDKKSINEISKENFNIDLVLESFTRFFDNLNYQNLQIWSNGKYFDLPILENAFNLCGLKKPWKYSNERDVRTLLSLYPDVKNLEYCPNVIKHHPIDDCKHQIRECSKVWKYIMNKI